MKTPIETRAARIPTSAGGNDVVIECYALTDVGRTRSHNEDSFAVADLTDRRAELSAARQELAAAERQAAGEEAAARRRAMVPAKETVDVVLRYEGHLQRQLTQTLHELERRQALRSDAPPQLPVAVDITVHAAEGVTLPALPGG